MKYKDYIGVFDSGVGGISVLKELIKILPNENFIFYGDSLHSPYGDKTKQDIINLSTKIADYLVNSGVKAIVIACNTATSAASEAIRSRYPSIPIIGIEPAIKPAILAHKGEDILVMATEATIKLEKFNDLKKKFDTQANIIPVACSGLAEAIENEQNTEEILNRYLFQFKNKINVVVLGCTHYPFIKNEIREYLGNVEFYDGGHGTAINLKNQLHIKNMLSKNSKLGKVLFESSSNKEDLYKKFLWRNTDGK